MKRTRGFTLLEILAVTTVIAILAALAIPSFQKARISANESATISAIRSLTTANNQYVVRFGSYAGSLANLGDSGMIDEALAGAHSGTGRSGYLYTYGTRPAGWTVAVAPVSPGVTGSRYFWADETGVIRQNDSAPAGATDTPIQ